MQPGSGLLAAFVCSLFPAIYRSSRHFNLELAVTAAVVLSVYLFFRTEMFKNKKYSILMGISLGIGMLMKYTLLFFLMPILTVAFINIILKKEGQEEKKDQISNFTLCVLIGIIISAIFYANPLVIGRFIVRSLELPPFSEDKTIIGRFVYYVSGFVSSGIGSIFSIGIFFCSLLFVNNRIAYKQYIYLWIFMPIFLLAISPRYYQFEYIIPLIPAASLLAAVGVYRIKKKIYRIIAAFLILSLGLFQAILAQGPAAKSIFFSLDDPPLYMYNAFRVMGSKKFKIAFISGPETLKCFYGLEQFIAVCSKNLSRVENFSFSCFDPDLAAKYDFIVTASQDPQTKDKLFLRKAINNNGLSDFKEIDFYAFFETMWKPVAVCFFKKREIYIKDENCKMKKLFHVKAKEYFYFERFIKMSRKYTLEGEYEKSYACLQKTVRIENLCTARAIEIVNELNVLSRRFRSLAMFEKSLIYSEEAISLILDKNRFCKSNGFLWDFFCAFKKNKKECLKELDELFIDWKDTQKAIDFYKQLDARYPNDKDINLRLAQQYKLLRNYSSSKEYFQKVLELAPGCWQAQEGVSNADLFLAEP
ncbi:MAG: glycosyltransferase family 39 protein [Candidatus Omnitrophica bacterium]|nr:glycosyltransferase family 39 protein [Candidatus Omnitrophota bacterium]